MLLIIGRKISDEIENSQSSTSASSNRVTTPPPLTLAGDQHQTKGIVTVLITDSIEEKLNIIKKPEKRPDKNEIFCHI